MHCEYSLEYLNFVAFMKQNKHKMRSEGFSSTWPNLFLNTNLQQSKNFSEFCKVLPQFAFRNMIVPLPKSQTRHPACARSFFDEKSFAKSFPSSHLLSRNRAKTLQVFICNNFFSRGDRLTLNT